MSGRNTRSRARNACSRKRGLPEKEGGWYVVPGKVDKVSYLLLVFFAGTILFLYLFNRLIG